MRHRNWTALLVAITLAGVVSAGDIQVLCEPGLRVYLDGKLTGISTRLDDGAYLMEVAPGPHTVRVEKDGYLPRSFEVAVGPVPIEVPVGDLAPAPPPNEGDTPPSAEPPVAVGSLVVTSAPQICVVEVDGSARTKSTPQLTIGGLTAGQHTVTFLKPGYDPVSEVVTVRSGAVVTVRGNLKAAKVETVHEGAGSLQLLSEPARCTVRILGMTREKTDLVLNLTHIPAGEHPLSVSMGGRELTTTVLIANGQRTVVKVSFMKGDEPFAVSQVPE